MVGAGLSGQRVLLVYPQGLDFVVAFFACQLSRAVAVPLAPLHPSRRARDWPRLLNVVSDCEPKAFLGDLATLTALAPWKSESPALAAMAWWTEGSLLGETKGAPLPPERADALAFLQYTSGSTSAPKGVRISHANVTAGVADIIESYSLGPGSVIASWLPTFHDMGLIGKVLTTVVSGAHLHLLSPVEFLGRPYRWLAAISEFKAYASAAPNFAYALAAAKVTDAQLEGIDLSSWRIAINGAEPVTAQAMNDFVARFSRVGFRADAFRPAYGLAEATLLASTPRHARPLRVFDVSTQALAEGRVEMAVDGVPSTGLVSCGPPAPQVDMAVVDSATGKVVPDGTLGEIRVSGPAISSGYWRDIDDSGFEGEGARYFRTGDLGARIEGEFVVTGRIKELVIVNGRNYAPRDIEAAVLSVVPEASSLGCVAFGIERDGSEAVVVALELERGALGGPHIEAAVKTELSRQFDLEVHELVTLPRGSLPKTTSGKPMRRAVKAAFLAGRLKEST